MTNMIKLYKIRIGEKVYEVEVEAVSEKEGSITTSNNVDNEPKEKKIEHNSSLNEVSNSIENSEMINAPMQGLIVDVKVETGQKVKAGDEVVILEAMKMENPIVAPKDGTILEIKVSKGSTVNTGDTLVILS
ncbi:hypothetical protein HMPREF9108_00940 [Leptotrichia sp. oral taxon 225 str. F0581]|nr:hypothetical protein HMPREF9108_00940 [Leptotrichia sp. oral taxon 225 str. F0581]